jgi:muramoyltetrapeptide carboxypeptidase
MKFPKAIKPNAKIGITAPSSGVSLSMHPRLDCGMETLRRQGYEVEEGRCLRENVKHVSAARKERAEELMSFWNDESIALIFPPWGGEVLIEILPLLDFSLCAKKPKWILGFSDLSTLLLPLTILSDIATAHGSNLMDYQASQSDPFTLKAIEALKTEVNDSFVQHSSRLWQKDWPNVANSPGSPFHLAEPTCWKRLGRNQNPVTFHGRLIGGCLDTLQSLVGTIYGDVPSFARRYKSEKTIVYLENCDQKPADLVRALWNFRLAGWFENCAGLVFGRSSGPDNSDPKALSYVDALEMVLGDLDLPVIFDADIGHLPPQMTLINGALAEVNYSNDAGSISQTFKP